MNKYIKPVTILSAISVFLLFNSTPNASEMDSLIESSAKSSYVFNTYLKNDAITIQSKDDGIVILSGNVSDESHRSLAEETIVAIPGVKYVDNKIEVKGEQPKRNSDQWIAMNVKSSFVYHKSVSGTSADVSVKKGIVTLMGNATSGAQKELMTEYAQDVEGVKEVKNEMKVLNTPKNIIEVVAQNIDDASITAQVKTSLLFHRSTNPLTTKVETKSGQVTVSGIAKNDAERALVTKLANDINGVKNVINIMILE